MLAGDKNKHDAARIGVANGYGLEGGVGVGGGCGPRLMLIVVSNYKQHQKLWLVHIHCFSCSGEFFV